MNYPLAIFAPQIGARSETFIRRHMEDLLPGRTVAVAESDRPPYAGHWNISGPTLVLERGARLQLPQRAVRFALKRLGWKLADPEVIAVRKFLKTHNVTVAMGEFLHLSLPWFTVCQQLGIRFFAHAHGYDVSAALREENWRTEYLRYKQVAGIITVSEVSRQRLVNLGLAADHIHVIPCSVDVPQVFPQRDNAGVLRCLAVGRMTAKKAPILTLDAFRRASTNCPTLRLDYIGTGELLPAARQFVQAFNLGDKVTLHGGQSNETVKQMLLAANIFLQHSITDPDTGDEEGLPVGILEAMAAGLPVVSTRHAGIPEAVQDGITGFLVDEGDSTGMAEQIVALASEQSLRQTMGEAGWQRARDHFSWEQEKAGLLRILGLQAA